PIVRKKFRIADRIPPLDAGVIHRVQEHVHLGQGPGRPDVLLAVQRVVLRTDLLAALDEQRARTTGRVTDPFPRLWIDQPSDELGYFGRRVDLPRFLTRTSGKATDQVFVRVADDVQVADPAGAKVELG